MNYFPITAVIELPTWLPIVGILFVTLLAVIAVVVILQYGGLWLQAYMSNADVSLISLIGMSLRRVKASSIVRAQVMASQAGVIIAKVEGRAHPASRHTISRGVMSIE